jgi:hypothetical protein
VHVEDPLPEGDLVEGGGVDGVVRVDDLRQWTDDRSPRFPVTSHSIEHVFDTQEVHRRFLLQPRQFGADR